MEAARDEEELKMEKSAFAQNEIVLCYEPDPLKAKMLYEAKVLDIGITKDEKGNKVSEYYVHFQGWNKKWDRWVLEDQILKNDESSRALQGRLYKKAIQPRKRKRQSSYEKSEESEESDEETTDSEESSSSDEEEEIKMTDLPRITLAIPKPLCNRLEDDCYNINRKKKLIRLPRKPNVNGIFQSYYTHCEELLQKGELKTMTLQMVEECLEGLYVYFNYYLETLLLYQFEREQYTSFFPWKEKPDLSKISRRKSTSPIKKTQRPSNIKTEMIVNNENKLKSEAVKQTYSIRILRTEKKLSSVSETSSSDSAVSKRLRSSSSTQQPPEQNTTPIMEEIPVKKIRHSIFDPPVFDLSVTVRETRSKKNLDKKNGNKNEDANTGKIVSATVNTEISNQKEIEDVYQEVDSIPSENTSRLRRSVRLPKVSEKLHDGTDDDSLCSGSTTKDIKEVEDEKVSDSIEECSSSISVKKTESLHERSFMYFPQTLKNESPADIYGPEHLLRLFVKLPVLLAASNIEDARATAILRYVTHFIGYLTNAVDIFQDSVYSESAI